MPSYLIENAVANPDAVTKYAEDWAKKVRAPEAKAWLAKRLRVFVLNDASLMKRLAPEDMTDSMPDYVHAAAQRGEPVYFFYGWNVEGFNDRVSHIVDFFDSLYDVANNPVNQANSVEIERQQAARKITSKLQKMTLPQVEAAHEEWLRRSNKQVANLSKEGCEVILTFGDGRYWVRYTDAATMKRDGSDLQNCLGTGNYWSQVSDGSQAVYGLRKANDEAVVGVRVILSSESRFDRGPFPQLAECKGKQNQPALPEDVPFIIALMEHLGITNSITDLKNAGVHVNNGKFGTFEEIAETAYEEGGVKIIQTVADNEVRRLVRVKRHQFWANGTDVKSIHSLVGIDAIPQPNLIMGLNALTSIAKFDNNSTALNSLAEMGIFPSETGFGSVDDVGQTVWTGEGDDRLVSLLRDGTGFVFYYLGGKTVRLTVRNSVIPTLPRGIDLTFLRAAIPGLNKAKLRFDTELDQSHMWPSGIVATKTGYHEVEDVAKVVYRLPEKYELQEVTEKLPIRSKLFFMDPVPADGSEGSGHYVTFVVGSSLLTVSSRNALDAKLSRNVVGAIQYIAAKHRIVDIDYDGLSMSAGLMYDPQSDRLLATVDDTIAVLTDPHNLAKYDYLSKTGNRGHLNSVLLKAFYPAGRENDGTLKKTVQAKLFRALKPTAAELVREISSDDIKVKDVIYRATSITIADALLVIAERLPDYEQQIAQLVDLITRALEITIKKSDGKIMFKFEVQHGWDNELTRNAPWGQMISKANEECRAHMTATSEAQEENGHDNSDDFFTAHNAMRRSGVRR